MNSAGLSPFLETANLTIGYIRRPIDVSVNNWSLGKSAAINHLSSAEYYYFKCGN